MLPLVLLVGEVNPVLNAEFSGFNVITLVGDAGLGLVPQELLATTVINPFCPARPGVTSIELL